MRVECLDDLSPRQRQIALLVNDGLASKEIAHLLGISTQTVKNHLHTIYRALEAVNGGTYSRVALAIWVEQQHGRTVRWSNVRVIDNRSSREAA